MRLRQKIVENEKLIVQYIYGNKKPYLGVVFIDAGTNAQANALHALSDDLLIQRVQQELGEQMMSDLQAAYG